MPDLDPARAALFLAVVCAVALVELAVRARLAGLPLVDVIFG